MFQTTLFVNHKFPSDWKTLVDLPNWFTSQVDPFFDLTRRALEDLGEAKDMAELLARNPRSLRESSRTYAERQENIRKHILEV